jgi:small conductance mechanosensitive channel
VKVIWNGRRKRMNIEKKSVGSALIRLGVSLAVCAAAVLIAHFAWDHAVMRVIAMGAGVIFCASLVILLLGMLKPKAHRGRTLVTLLSSLVRYVAALVILCWGLSMFGVDVNTIVASVGVVALIVGFGAESLIADLVTGIFMLFENQYNVGDIVEVNGFRGTVKDIGIRTTSIVDTGKNVKIVNNSDMKNILNRSDNASIAVATIDIPYPTDLEGLEKQIPTLMEEIYRNHSDIMLSAPRYLGVQELGASGITLKFIVEIEEADIFSAPRVLNHDLLLGFRRLGVECPYPQLDIHNC